MANRRLAQRLIDTITPGKSVREIRDTELRGFGIRVLPSGRKSFFVHAQNDGRRTWTKIGDASALPLADARDLARSSLAASRTGDQSRPSEIAAETPFEDIADAVFRRQSRHWKPGTLEVNRNYLKNQSLPRFRGQPIGAITGADVQEWFASLRSTPAADRAAPVLSVIMRDAETLGFRPEGTNPCGKIRRYRRRGRERFLSREETRRLGAVLKLHEGHVLAAAVKLLALTGCRKSEIMTLQWQDCRDGHLFLRDGKTGLRTVWLSSAARAVLDDLPRRSVWVFPGRACTGPAKGLNIYWLALRQEAGLRDVRLHDLRHSYASLALQAGETVPTIGRLLGHSKPETTLKYIHLADQAVRDAVDAVAPILGGEGRP